MKTAVAGCVDGGGFAILGRLGGRSVVVAQEPSKLLGPVQIWSTAPSPKTRKKAPKAIILPRTIAPIGS